MAAAAFWIFTLDKQSSSQRFGGVAGQALIWQTVSRPRVYFALQALFGATLAISLSVPGLFLRMRFARVLLLAAVLGFLSYYRLEPRFRASDWWYLARGILLLFGGAASFGYVISQADCESKPGARLWEFVKVLLCFTLLSVLGNLITDRTVTADSRELAASLSLFCVGGLLWSVYFGPEKNLFSPGTVSKSNLGKKQILYLFCLIIFFFIATNFFLAEGLVGERIKLALLTPVLPVIGAIYSAWTWFQIPGPPQVFSLSGVPAASTGESGRIYLSLFFQWLTLGTVLSIWSALRGPRNNWMVLLAILMLLGYLMPSCWFVRRFSEFSGVGI